MATSRKRAPYTRTVSSSAAFDIRVAIAQLDTWLGAYHPDTHTTPTYTHLLEARAHLARIREGASAKDARAHKSAAMQHISYALGLTKPKAST